MPRYEGFGPPYNPIYAPVPSHWEYTVEIVHHDEIPAVTHPEQRVKTAAKTVVMTNRFVPRGSYATFDEAINKMQARHKNPVNLKETRLVGVELRGTKILRHFMEFTTDGNTLGLEGRKGFLE